LQYRLAPHCTTKVPPAEFLFNCTIRGKLPVLPRKPIVNRRRETCNSDQQNQQYEKEYCDVQRHIKGSDVAVRDFLLVKQQKENKLTTQFDTNRYVVIERQGTQVITVNRDQCNIKHNLSHVKRMPKPETWTSDSDDDLPSQF